MLDFSFNPDPNLIKATLYLTPITEQLSMKLVLLGALWMDFIKIF
jgi:hypothetical protein